jgi:surfactin synthase thioesterase subunit
MAIDGMSLHPDPVSTPSLVRFGPASAKTLVCLSFCGGGSSAYRHWAGAVPEGLGLAAVCYPGREGRFREPFARRWDDLVADAVDIVQAAAERPYVLFGHSMGSWVAFAVTGELERRGVGAPEMVIVSSCNPPDRGLTPRDRFPAATDTDGDLMAWIGRHGLMPAHVLNEPALQTMALRLMRADIALRDTFQPNRARISAPLHVVSAQDDAVIADDAQDRWRALTSGPFSAQTLPGGHFYTPEIWRRLPAHLLPLQQLEQIGRLPT